jgi:AcrR family transcriptional regulator
MHAMQDGVATGLRARKKAATKRAIEIAAVDIAFERGHEGATAEAIAAKAGVSLRTFFNYFPSKDLAIIGKHMALIQSSEALAILEACDCGLLKGIVRVSGRCVVRSDIPLDVARRRHRLTGASPVLLQAYMLEVAKLEEWLAEVVAEYLESHPELHHPSLSLDDEALLAVGLVSAAIRFQLRRGGEHDPDKVLADDEIESAIDMMADINRKEP